MRRWRMGYRFKRFTLMAYGESHLPLPSGIMTIPVFPKGFLDNFDDMSFEKNIDYNFIGCIYINQGVECNRQWTLEFAKTHFTNDSYFRLNSNEDFEKHEVLGDFDYTFSYEAPRFVEKYLRMNLKRCRFDRDYFDVMCRSKFTLCPTGDEPWSQRFFDAIMSRSIPILEKKEHCGLYPPQRELGYKFYLLGDDYVYRQDWVDYNYDLFLQKQTLFGRDEDGN